MLKKIKDVWAENHLSTQAKKYQSSKKYELVGANDDRGVLNVGGRIGASHGPDSIRKLFGEYMLGMNSELEQVIFNKGKNLPQTKTIEEAHSLIRNKVKTLMDSDVFPIVLGGGHDFGYPHFAGVADHFQEPIALINVDAHLDVRKPNEKGITSGSPFYLCIESKVLKPEHFIEFGIQNKCNHSSLREYCNLKKIKIITLPEAREYKDSKSKGAIACFEKQIEFFSKKKLKTVISFDLDCVQMAFSPGVSAPQADGFTASEFLEMAEISGKNKNIVGVGFFEFAPDLDSQNLSAHLVSTAIHRFLCAHSAR